MPQEISADEVYRNVEKLEKRIEQGFKDIRVDINTMFMRFVSIDKYDALVDRVESLEDAHKWQARTIIALVAGAVISAIIGAIAIKAGIPS